MGSMEKVQFPNWLPDSVVEYAKSIPTESQYPECYRITITLTTRLEMKPVWKALSENAKHSSSIKDLLDEIILSLSWWEFLKQEGLLLSPQKRNERINEVINAIDNLRTILNKNPVLCGYDRNYTNPIDKELDSIEQFVKYTPFWNHIPTKIGASTSKRTFLLKILKPFMRREFQKPLSSEIGTIVGLIFDEDITDDDVRKA